MLKGAIVGFGRMGVTHYSILNCHPQVQFAAICDPSSAIVEQVRRQLKAPAFDDFDKLVDAARPDFVIVASPTFAHAPPLLRAIAEGIHVFVEKPFCLSAAEGAKIVAALDGKDIVHQVGYVYRFNDVFMKVRELLLQGAIGDPLTFKFEMYGRTVLRAKGGSWRAKKSRGGGCLRDFASHAVDFISYCFGPPQRVAGSVLKRIYSQDVEDAVSSTFIYPSGLTGHLLANWSDASYRKPTLRFEVLGSKGKVVADLHAYKVFFSNEPDVEGFTKGWNTRYITDFVEPVRFYLRGYEFTRQLDHFVARILDRNSTAVCSFHDGLTTDQIIERIAQDSKNQGN